MADPEGPQTNDIARLSHNPEQRRRALHAEIASLPSLDLAALHLRWRNETGRATPAQIPKFLLLRMLAYRMQANIYGDLDAATVKILDRVARQKKLEAADRGAGRHRRCRPRTLKPGTILVREWEGILQRVTVLADGYAWNGKTFRSLSTVAKAITGTQWSGPRFFGLLPRKNNVPPTVTEEGVE